MVPDASTLSRNRIHYFNNKDIFWQIFDHILEQALTHDMERRLIISHAEIRPSA
ncbi:hypothetical protein ABW286_17985 [Erwinia papayae]|uniref:Uncharacterized protein n=1 Tax=Erwinia papayae TaxID=206499 RepID=A0ABV3N5N6_9GAMM